MHSPEPASLAEEALAGAFVLTVVENNPQKSLTSWTYTEY